MAQLQRKVPRKTYTAIKKKVGRMEAQFVAHYKAFAEIEIVLPFICIMNDDDEILQLRVRCDPNDDTTYVIRQMPIIRISYEHRHEKGIAAPNLPGFRYFEFAWIGVKIRAYFEPTLSWGTRTLIFRFADTNAIVMSRVTCKLADMVPPMPAPPVLDEEARCVQVLTHRIKTYAERLLSIKEMMNSILITFDNLSEKYI